jgi:hypothetical protein
MKWDGGRNEAAQMPIGIAAVNLFRKAFKVKCLCAINDLQETDETRIGYASPVVTLMLHNPTVRLISGYRLFVGPAMTLKDPAAVLATGVQTVICVAAEKFPDPWPRDLPFLRLPLDEGASNSEPLVTLLLHIVGRLIAEDVPTLIVCSMGMSRSVGVAAASIALYEGAAPDDVLRRVVKEHPADMSPSLWDSLRRFVQQIQVAPVDRQGR